MASSPISIELLLMLPDKAFITQAYRIILDRDPDTEGFLHYADQLWSGYAKEHVLMQLKQSSEASDTKIQIDGLDEVISHYKRGRIPVIGWLYRWIRGEAGYRKVKTSVTTLDRKIQLLYAVLEKQNPISVLDIPSLLNQQSIDYENALNTMSPAAKAIYTELKSSIKLNRKM